VATNLSSTELKRLHREWRRRTPARLSIGLEDPADLVADLERALAPLVAAASSDADQSLSSAAWP